MTAFFWVGRVLSWVPVFQIALFCVWLLFALVLISSSIVCLFLATCGFGLPICFILCFSLVCSYLGLVQLSLVPLLFPLFLVTPQCTCLYKWAQSFSSVVLYRLLLTPSPCLSLIPSYRPVFQDLSHTCFGFLFIFPLGFFMDFIFWISVSHFLF